VPEIVVSIARWIGHSIHEYREEIIALGTVVIAFFTFTLWRSTYKLWRSGENQIALIKENFEKELVVNREIAKGNWDQLAESIAASVASAKASTSQAESAARQAKIAEDVLFKIERPYVLITNLSLIKPPSTTLEGNDKVRIISDHHITYRVGNFGRTAALIHEIRHVFQVADSKTVPENPFSATPPHRLISEGMDAGYAIAAGAIEPDQYFTLPKHVEIIEKRGFLEPKSDSGNTIFMFVRIRYEDAGADASIRDRVSTWKYDFGSHHFLKCGGKQHNYEKEIGDPA
jgi:hypothetical protein